MRHLIGLLIFTLLVTGSHAFWAEEIDFLAIDVLGRPIKDATITVVYQSFNCATHADIIKKTDSQGIAHFEFINTIPETAVTANTTCVERSYSIISSFAGTTNTTIGHLNRSNKLYEVRFQVTYHTLLVRDAYDSPLVPSIAEYQGLSFETDKSGRMFIPLPIGKSIEINITYRNITKTITRKENSETISKVNLSVYDLKVKLFNQRGVRLVGNITIDDLTQRTNVSSSAIFERFGYDQATFKIAVKDRRKTIIANITGDTIDLYVDLAPPSIRDLSIGVTSSKNLEFKVSIVDEGLYASGLLTNPIIEYDIGDGLRVVKMFPTSAIDYEATIPAKGNNTVYKISAIDLQENIGSHEGNYTFTEEKQPEVKELPQEVKKEQEAAPKPAEVKKVEEPANIEIKDSPAEAEMQEEKATKKETPAAEKKEESKAPKQEG